MKVSILLPCYNGASYLRTCLDTILEQSFGDFELHVCDDGSKDETLLILKEYAELDPRIKLTVNPQNYGTGRSYTNLLRKCQGEYIAQIGQDDLWAPQFLQALCDQLDSSPSLSAVFCEPVIIDEHGQPLEGRCHFATQKLQDLSRWDLACELIRRNFLCAASSLFRRRFLQDVELLGDNDQLQDWEIWQQLILKGGFGYLPSRLASYRIHSQNLSIGGGSVMQSLTDSLHSRFQMLRAPALPPLINAQPSPEKAFERFISCYLSSEEWWPPGHIQLLLFSLRNHFYCFEPLAGFHLTLTLLHWYEGALHKAQRLKLNQGESSQITNHLMIRGQWCYYACLSRKPNARSWMHQTWLQIGALQIGRVFVRKKSLPLLTLSCARIKSSPLQILESRMKAKFRSFRELASIACNRMWMKMRKAASV